MFSANNLILDSVHVIFNIRVAVSPTTTLAISHPCSKYSLYFLELNKTTYLLSALFGFCLL